MILISVGIITLIAQSAIDPAKPSKSKIRWGWTTRQYKTNLIIGGIGMIMLGLLPLFLEWAKGWILDR